MRRVCKGRAGAAAAVAAGPPRKKVSGGRVGWPPPLSPESRSPPLSNTRPTPAASIALSHFSPWGSGRGPCRHAPNCRALCLWGRGRRARARERGGEGVRQKKRRRWAGRGACARHGPSGVARPTGAFSRRCARDPAACWCGGSAGTPGAGGRIGAGPTEKKATAADRRGGWLAPRVFQAAGRRRPRCTPPRPPRAQESVAQGGLRAGCPGDYVPMAAEKVARGGRGEERKRRRRTRSGLLSLSSPHF